MGVVFVQPDEKLATLGPEAEGTDIGIPAFSVTAAFGAKLLDALNADTVRLLTRGVTPPLPAPHTPAMLPAASAQHVVVRLPFITDAKQGAPETIATNQDVEEVDPGTTPEEPDEPVGPPNEPVGPIIGVPTDNRQPGAERSWSWLYIGGASAAPVACGIIAGILYVRWRGNSRATAVRATMNAAVPRDPPHTSSLRVTSSTSSTSTCRRGSRPTPWTLEMLSWQ